MVQRDPPIPAPPIDNEFLSGLPRNRALSSKEPPVSAWNVSPKYERNMGDDTPIKAYSLRGDYERNSEWYPTKTIRDWKTVDRQPNYPRTTKTPALTQKPMEATDKHWGTQLRSDYVFDRSRG